MKKNAKSLSFLLIFSSFFLFPQPVFACEAGFGSVMTVMHTSWAAMNILLLCTLVSLLIGIGLLLRFSMQAKKSNAWQLEAKLFLINVLITASFFFQSFVLDRGAGNSFPNYNLANNFNTFSSFLLVGLFIAGLILFIYSLFRFKRNPINKALLFKEAFFILFSTFIALYFYGARPCGFDISYEIPEVPWITQPFNFKNIKPQLSTENVNQEVNQFDEVSPKPLASPTLITPSASLSYTYSRDYMGDDVTFSYLKNWQSHQSDLSGAMDFIFTQKGQVVQVDLDCGHDLNYEGMVEYIKSALSGWNADNPQPTVKMVNRGQISNHDFGSFLITPGDSSPTEYADVLNVVDDYRCQLIILGNSVQERQIVDEMANSVVIIPKQIVSTFQGTVWMKDEDNNQETMTLTFFINPRTRQQTYYLREQYSYNKNPQDTTVTGTWKIIHNTSKYSGQDVYLLSSGERNNQYFLTKDADHLELLDSNQNTITGVSENLILTKSLSKKF